MREGTFVKSSTADTHRVSLLDRIEKRKAAPEPKPEPEQEKKSAEQSETTTTPDNKEAVKTPSPETGKAEPGKEEQPSSVTVEDGDDYDEFKEGIKGKLEDYIGDPKEFAEMIIGFVDIGRIIFLPNIYHGLAFPGQERIDIEGIVAKAIINEKDKKDPMDGFNDYERRLYKKWPKVRDAMDNVGYDEADTKILVKVIARRIESMGVTAWMAKYDWLIAFAYIEFKHGKNIAQGRANDFIAKKFAM